MESFRKLSPLLGLLKRKHLLLGVGQTDASMWSYLKYLALHSGEENTISFLNASLPCEIMVKWLGDMQVR